MSEAAHNRRRSTEPSQALPVPVMAWTEESPRSLDDQAHLEEALECLAALPLDEAVLANLDEQGLVQVVREAPGLYHLRLERADLLVQNARLLHRLLQERRWLEAAVHHLSSGVVIVDAAGRIVGFNLAMEKLSGKTLDQGIGLPIAQVFEFFQIAAPDDLFAWWEFLEAGHHGRALPTEMLLRPLQGSPIDVEVSREALFDDRGEPLGAILSVRDIRTRKERERLERIFLSGVSHELKTPVAIIRGFAGLLADPDLELGPEQRRQHAAIILAESERLERLVNDLLDATRLQSGGLPLQRARVDVRRALLRVVQKLAPGVVEPSYTLRLRPGPELQVWADAQRIDQVLLNLVENALKYARGGEAAHLLVVELEARSLGDRVEVAVSDNGPGVLEQDRVGIFQAFVRGGRGERPSGSGLGLFVSKALVEAHHGQLGVERSNLGGARFWFTLPLYSEQDPS